MYYAYILKSTKDPAVFYHGFTSDLRKRLSVHNRGANPSTRAMLPWIVAWYGAFDTEEGARAFEHYLKTASGKAFARKRLLSQN
jgi:predicted GIY-YIG superfamily endonuclease